MINIKQIKNRIKQIENNNIKFKISFPHKDNMGKNRFRKFSVSTIFIDISNFTQSCENNKNNNKFYIKLRCFHEGILDILRSRKIRNIDIQGDGIFGIVESKKNKDLLDSANDIKNFLDLFLGKYFKYKISLFFEKEVILIVGKKHERELVYCGRSISNAKKLNDKSKNNIVMNENFYKCIIKKYNNLSKKIKSSNDKTYYIYEGEYNHEWKR